MFTCSLVTLYVRSTADMLRYQQNHGQRRWFHRTIAPSTSATTHSTYIIFKSFGAYETMFTFFSDSTPTAAPAGFERLATDAITAWGVVPPFDVEAALRQRRQSLNRRRNGRETGSVFQGCRTRGIKQRGNPIKQQFNKVGRYTNTTHNFQGWTQPNQTHY